MNLMWLASIPQSSLQLTFLVSTLRQFIHCPCFAWEAAAACLDLSSCSQTKLVTICILSANVASPHDFQLSPSPNPALPLCTFPMIFPCCNAPWACWTASRGYHTYPALTVGAVFLTTGDLDLDNKDVPQCCCFKWFSDLIFLLYVIFFILNFWVV